LPCGGEDIDTFVGDIRLTKAVGNENFVTLGTYKSEQFADAGIGVNQ